MGAAEASRYHPRMLFKAMLCACLDGARSSRRIAKSLLENVHCMWLFSSHRPDFRVQISTEQQSIADFTLHQYPTNTPTLDAHLDQFRKLYGIDLEAVVADSAYGSAANYRA